MCVHWIANKCIPPLQALQQPFRIEGRNIRPATCTNNHIYSISLGSHLFKKKSMLAISGRDTAYNMLLLHFLYFIRDYCNISLNITCDFCGVLHPRGLKWQISRVICHDFFFKSVSASFFPFLLHSHFFIYVLFICGSLFIHIFSLYFIHSRTSLLWIIAFSLFLSRSGQDLRITSAMNPTSPPIGGIFIFPFINYACNSFPKYLLYIALIHFYLCVIMVEPYRMELL